MKILVINTGSSSIKYQLFDMADESVLASGVMEKIGESNSVLTHKLPKKGKDARIVKEEPVADHREGLIHIVDLLTDGERGVIHDTSEIAAVGHRVVHGGESFRKPALIDDKVIETIREYVPLAPLHNPGNLVGIEVARGLFKDVPQVAVFDTAFHQTIPPYAFHYALPYDLYEKYHVRRYGFHGTSHRFVAKEAAKFLGKPLEETNLITIHLGNGGSITAIEKGHSVDTSMGMTPLEGVIMGTRCGDLDPAIHFFLAKEAQMSIQDLDNLMNKKSGLKGICGVNDMRDIQAKKDEGDYQSALAIDMYAYRIKKYIGAYSAVLGEVDALVFTAGIGENAPNIRAMSCTGLTALGINIDAEKNTRRPEPVYAIHTEDSRTKVLVVSTNEELEIAEETMDVVEAL